MSWLLWVFILFSVFYIGVVLLVIYALNHLERNIPSKNTPFISIVIAARNEETRLGPLLSSLQQLSYPADRFEVIFVDDHSSDQTVRLLMKEAATRKNWSVLRIEQDSDKYHAKKMALAKGVDHARGRIIFVTDADCRVPRDWLQTMVSYFDEKTDMVLGYSPLEDRSGFLDKWLKFDNLFSAITVAAPVQLGFPISSVGRNMAFLKSAYERVGGYRALTGFRSGDDIHLTERMRDLSPGEIRYCAHPDSFVYTQPPDTGREIFYQQLRKNSKILDKSRRSAAFSIVLFLAYALFFTLPLFNSSWLTVWAVVLAGKYLLEYVALHKSCKIFRNKELIPYLPLMMLLYPFYVMILGFIGYLHLYEWK